MNEMPLPSAEAFAARHPEYRPVVAIRAICNHGHALCEYWLTETGDTRPWAGLPGAVHQEGVNGFKGFGGTSAEDASWRRDPVNSDRPEEIYFRTHYVCVRPTCNYRLTFDKDSTDQIEDILHLLDTHRLPLANALAGDLPGAYVFQHPAAKVGLACELNALLQVHRRVQ